LAYILLVLVWILFDYLYIKLNIFVFQFIINQIWKYLIYFAFAFVGFVSLPISPISMDLSLECVYPIPEATATGISVMSR
jgi:hypothetical protein